jgi:hypothetical protein
LSQTEAVIDTPARHPGTASTPGRLNKPLLAGQSRS